jgi:hypothetical protein
LLRKFCYKTVTVLIFVEKLLQKNGGLKYYRRPQALLDVHALPERNATPIFCTKALRYSLLRMASWIGLSWDGICRGLFFENLTALAPSVQATTYFFSTAPGPAPNILA